MRRLEDLPAEDRAALLDYLVEKGLLVQEDDGLEVTALGEDYIASGFVASMWTGDTNEGDHTATLTVRVQEGTEAATIFKLEKVCNGAMTELASKGITLAWKIEVLKS